VRVRRAIAHAINKDAIVKNLLPGGASKVINASCHPLQVGCTQDVTTYAYDPAKARALLKEAGHETGLTLEMTTFRPDYRRYLEAIMADLRAVGITPQLDFIQFPAFRQKEQAGKLRSYFVGWGAGGQVDVSLTLFNFFGGGGADYAGDAELAGLVRQQSGILDPGKRVEVTAAAFKRVADQAYAIPVSTLSFNYVLSKDLTVDIEKLDAIPNFATLAWK
jgi:peptide/nickel transport system substrate-binding protein